MPNGSIIVSKTITHTHEDADGKVTINSTEETFNYHKKPEPDYIKLYTRMWCDFNEIPTGRERELFIYMAQNMSYAGPDSQKSQIVATGGPFMDTFCEKYKIKKSRYQGLLKSLCEHDAIKKIRNGWYQINPMYAGRGEWKYNPRLDRGGVENLVATFNFANKTVATEIVWGTTDKNIIGNADSVVASQTVIAPQEEMQEGQKNG